MANNLATQDFIKFLLHYLWQFAFRHSLPVYRFTGCKQAAPGSGFNFFLVTAGAGAAAEDDHHVDIVIEQRHQLKIPPLLSHLSQMTGYPAQVDARIAGTAILQGYLSFATILRHLC